VDGAGVESVTVSTFASSIYDPMNLHAELSFPESAPVDASSKPPGDISHARLGSLPWAEAVRALSLEITLGVLGAAGFAAHLTGVPMPVVWWFVLPATTWIVYSVDHLLDARRSRERPLSLRHRFHLDHARPIAGAVVALSVAVLFAALRLPGPVLLGGAALALVTLMHLVRAQGSGHRYLPKELSAALLYTAGIWFAPLLLARSIEPGLWLVIAIHFVAALLNLMTFALFERHEDAEDRHPSIISFWGVRRTRRVVAVLTGMALVTLMATAITGAVADASSITVLTLLIVAPLMLLTFESYFGVGLRYRVVGDGVFVLMILPAVMKALPG
jgi:hypothetical protein